MHCHLSLDPSVHSSIVIHSSAYFMHAFLRQHILRVQSFSHAIHAIPITHVTQAIHATHTGVCEINAQPGVAPS
eukprot:5918407-Lingulodinium_polyedra.AAC.1